MATQDPVWDYIIVGAGSAGCALAYRLTENPQIRVLLLEAGGRDRNMWIHIPAGYIKTLDMPGLNWRFETEPEEGTGNRRIPIPRGRVLGGSSSINGMVYVRGQPLDYDTWAQRGNRGWSYEAVLPYFRKSEHYESSDDPWRGKGGPLHTADGPERAEVLDAIMDAAEQCGYPKNPDYNSGNQEGFGYFQVTQKDGRRWSTAKAFLEPALPRPNLDLEINAHTTAVILEGTRAVGIRWRRDGTEHEARAGREVILCAGAVQSPQLLELSGIGDASRLRDLGIEVAHHLPGVGENYQDHYIVRQTWKVTTAGHAQRADPWPAHGGGTAALRGSPARDPAVSGRDPRGLRADPAGACRTRRPVHHRACEFQGREEADLRPPSRTHHRAVPAAP